MGLLNVDIKIRIEYNQDSISQITELLKFHCEYKDVVFLSMSGVVNQNNLFFFLNQDSSQTASYEDIKLILNRIGNGNEITLKQLEMHLSYHKFIKDKDTNYVKSSGYYKTNPIDHTKVLYYDVYNEYEQSKTSFSFKQKNNEY